MTIGRHAARLGGLLGVVALVFGVAPRPAAAWTINDPASGLAADVSVPGTTTCVFVPSSAQDPAACEGLDLAALGAIKAEGDAVPVGAAVFREGDATVVVVIALEGRTTLAAREDIDEYMHGVETGLIKRRTRGRLSSPELRTVRGVQSFRFDVTLEPATAELRNVVYVRQHKSASTLIFVLPGGDALARRILAAIDASIVFDGPQIEEFGVPRASRVGYFLGKASVPFLAIIVAVFLIWRSSRKKRKNG